MAGTLRSKLQLKDGQALKVLDAPDALNVAEKSSGIESDLTRDEGWAPLFDAGLRPVRQIAIDDTWSALRFRRVEHVG
jgi:hypothetical protein